MWNVNKVAVAIGLVGSLCASNPQAETCDMIGCGGLGYVFLPSISTFIFNGIRCKHATDPTTFSTGVYPPVNSLAKISGEDRAFYTESEIAAHLNDFDPGSLKSAQVGKICASNWSAPDGTLILQKGDIVRILGYRTFVGSAVNAAQTKQFGRIIRYPVQLEFALVEPN